ncbi:glycosyltransferase family 2 protein [Phormidium tenue FACHB-886]|nr:glycosyltransferase family 2 protein [Phormidium tenue FACHB-886]
MFLLSSALLTIALILLVPIGTLFVECLAALLPARPLPEPSSSPATIKTAVLIPAHNEAAGILPVLKSLLPQLTEHDRLVVVADNCTDDTAAIARSTGATVIERRNLDQRGKGYALDYGVNYLAADPPDVITIVDADCLVQPGTLSQIAKLAITKQQPVQALYLMEQPAAPKPRDAVSAFAFKMKNLVRPRGLNRFGFPCLLTGTGMAFPWAVLRSVKLASGNIVEDMQLGIDLAIAGRPVYFCETASVRGMLPQQDKASSSQRTRWEHGHLQTLLTQVPALLKRAVVEERLDLGVMALDLAVPPLSLLVMFWLVAIVLACIAALLTGIWLPVLLLAIDGSLLLTATLLAWAKFCRSDLPARTLLAIPLYMLWKIPLYLKFLVRPETKWVRTERDINTSKT